MNDLTKKNSKLTLLSLAALGVVFGDIGTSPLYAINEIFFGHGSTQINYANVLGCISLVIWAITLVVFVKYLVFVLRADNDGEGGVFALYGLLNQNKKKVVGFLMVLLMLAAGLLFGDGIITPAISVLSAVEGLKVAAPALAPFIVLITVIILTGLFAIQHKGTAKVGAVFGPIVAIWFVVIAILGVTQILQHPQILNAFNPMYAINFLSNIKFYQILLILGGVMLVITGGEALYADMGHFGKKPIRLSWFLVVYPALLLNYLGQGAYLLSGQTVMNHNIFYSMVPAVLLYPMIILATLATIIASQALISGAFSLTVQAIALGLFPRLKILQTHHEHQGQIYIGFINWALYVGCVILVVTFGSSSALASAYGLAVAGDMLVNSLAMMAVAYFCWKWHPAKGILLFGFFAFIDLSFLFANSLKFFEGGFIPLSIGLILFIVMATWKWGRKTTAGSYSGQKTMTIHELIALKNKASHLMNKTVVMMIPKTLKSEQDNTPALMQFFHDRYGLIPKNLIFLNVVTKKIPYIHTDRYHITIFQQEHEKGSVVGVQVQFGFMEEHNVEKILEELAKHHQLTLNQHPKEWLVHVSVERLFPGKKISLFRRIKLRLFLLLRQNSQPAYYYYGLGKDVNLSMELMPIKIE